MPVILTGKQLLDGVVDIIDNFREDTAGSILESAFCFFRKLYNFKTPKKG